MFAALVTAIAPSAVLAPTASEKVMAPVPATRVRFFSVAAVELIAPTLILPLDVVRVTPAPAVVKTVLPFRVKFPPANVILAFRLICPAPDVMSTKPPVVALESSPSTTIFPPDAAVKVRLLALFQEEDAPIVMVPVCPVVFGLPLVETKTFPPPRAVLIVAQVSVLPELLDAKGAKGLTDVPVPVVLASAVVVIAMSVGSRSNAPFTPFGAKVLTDPK